MGQTGKMMMSPDMRRRRAVRVTLPGEVRGAVSPGHEVTVVNLSPRGALIEHADRLALGESRILALRLGGVRFRLPARVIWSHLYRGETQPPEDRRFAFRSGLRFAALQGETERNLRQALAALRVPSG